jgi:hypothetical protein
MNEQLPALGSNIEDIDPVQSAFIDQVRRNCDISDAQHAGLYSICGLALRLRDLYKWQHGLQPWEEGESDRVLDWIGQKEELWETLSDHDYQQLTIDQKTFSPFDTAAINAALAPYGLVYAAGHAHSLKPSFVLARKQNERIVENIPANLLGDELARDLLTLPALHQDGCILLRQQAARYFLWDQIVYLNKSGRPVLRKALAFNLIAFDLDEIRSQLDDLLAIQNETYLYHELGEIKDAHFDRVLWQKIIATYAHTPIELLARSLKDLLADTGPYGALAQIVASRQSVGLGLYVAFATGFACTLFPELRPAFDRFCQAQDWQPIIEAVNTGYRRAIDFTAQLCDIFQEGQARQDFDWARNQIERRLLTCIKATA